MIKFLKRAIIALVPLIGPAAAHADEISDREPIIEPIPEYDVLEGPPGMEGIQTPQEFFASENAQNFLLGMRALFGSFGESVALGDAYTIDVPLDLPTPDANRTTTVNNPPEHVGIIEPIFSANCVDGNNIFCAVRASEVTAGMSRAFIGAVEQLSYLTDAEKDAVSSMITEACTTVPQRIIDRAPVNDTGEIIQTPMVQTEFILATELCLNAIDYAEEVTQLTYSPDAQALISSQINSLVGYQIR